MKLEVVAVYSRSAAFEIVEAGCYYSGFDADIYLNDDKIMSTDKNVFSLFSLLPDTHYAVEARTPFGTLCAQFTTARESCVCDVRAFGAVGDGQVEDTCKIQAAISCCLRGGTVYVPQGTYLTGPLFLKDGVTLYLEMGATLLGITQRAQFPVLPAFLGGEGNARGRFLGAWEGNAEDCYAGFVNAIRVTGAAIDGEGTLDANAQNGDWYVNPKIKRGAWRGRLIYTVGAKNFSIHGVTVKNSPSWTVHPTYSQGVDIIDIKIKNGEHSPNTDGIDPDACRDVRIIGADISVGDDCISLKSGKISLARMFSKPCENVVISDCIMRSGHGGVVIGSDMSGGVKNVKVQNCLMLGTDRGVRIKTRRGRGRKAVIENLSLSNIVMRGVKTPIAINMFYFCDPDGHSTFVQCRSPLPADESTPSLGDIVLSDITAERAQYAGCWVAGLPESPVRSLTLNNVFISFDKDATSGMPEMLEGISPCSKQAFYALNVSSVTLNNVHFAGAEGEEIILENVGTFSRH